MYYQLHSTHSHHIIRKIPLELDTSLTANDAHRLDASEGYHEKTQMKVLLIICTLSQSLVFTRK